MRSDAERSSAIQAETSRRGAGPPKNESGMTATVSDMLFERSVRSVNAGYKQHLHHRHDFFQLPCIQYIKE
jgi:hypothetical protein